MKRKNMPDMVTGNRIARRLSALKQATDEELRAEIERREATLPKINLAPLTKFDTGEEMPPKEY